MSGEKRSTFDELVAGISSEERRQLLNNINQNREQEILILQSEKEEDDGFLEAKYRNEPIIYRFILWIRSVFTKRSSRDLYNSDLVSSLGNKINKNHPGLLDAHNDLLLSLFYEKLKDIKLSADFFKPYFSTVNENPGKFYVFLSTFIAPQISEKITADADPYTIPFEREVTSELRTSLIKRMENDIKTIEQPVKDKLYSSVRSLIWLKQFSELPFIHFTSQFTAIVSSSYTCPFINAQTDYPSFARVLQNISPISKEALESLFLFSQRANLKQKGNSDDIEKSLREFMSKTVAALSSIQMFVSTVPVSSLGKVIFDEYEWQPGNPGGGEEWFVKFKDEWKNVFDARWLQWLHDKKKNQLADILYENFGLRSFPELQEKPWKTLWGGVIFRCEMTAGLLSWFVEVKSHEVMECLNIVILEGVFIKKENRTELANSINEMVELIQQVKSFLEQITSEGSLGSVFKKYEEERIHTIKAQQIVNSKIMGAETLIRNCGKNFCNASRSIERVFQGILEDTRTDKEYASLQNLMTIKGQENRAFRDSMAETMHTLKILREVFVEIEPLDLPQD